MKQYGTILVVDDNASILTAMRYLLDSVFERILTLESPDDILKTMAQEEIDIVLLDMNFTLGVNSGQEGLFWLRSIRKQHPQTPVVLLTAYADVSLAVRGLKSGAADFIAQYQASGDLYGLILNIIDTMPLAPVILVLVLITMIAFYATSFDSIAYTAASYSYKKIGEDEKPSKPICLLWCILLIVLPIALVFSESSMNNIQSVSIISAFPIGIIMILMIWSFFKDAKKYMKETKNAGNMSGDN